MNKTIRLYRLIGDIDDDYVTAAADAPQPRRHMLWIKIATVAASVALLVCGGYGIDHWRDMSAPVYGSANTVYTDSSVSAQVGQRTGYTISQLAARADVIVEADVLHNDYTEKSRYSEKEFVFYAQLSVREVLKGDVEKGDCFYVEDAAEGYYGMTSPHCLYVISCDGPLMEKGNRVVVFLRRYQNGQNETAKDGGDIGYYTALGADGRFFYDADGKYHCGPTYNTESEMLYFSQAVYLEDYEPKTLDEISGLISLQETARVE